MPTSNEAFYLTHFEWLLVALAGVFVFVWGLIVRSSEGLKKEMSAMSDNHEKDIAAIWTVLRAEQDRANAFRERIAADMVTKSDLREMKEDVLSAIYQQRPTPQPSRQ